MNTRYSFGGDEHIFVEIDEEMSLDAFFKSLSITQSIKAKNFDGVSEVYPANASFQIRFDPDIISPTGNSAFRPKGLFMEWLPHIIDNSLTYMALSQKGC